MMGGRLMLGILMSLMVWIGMAMWVRGALIRRQVRRGTEEAVLSFGELMILTLPMVGGVIAVVVEGLSLVGKLNEWWYVRVWGAILAGMFLVWFKRWSGPMQEKPGYLSDSKSRRLHLGKGEDMWGVILIGVLVGMVGVTAWWSMPTTGDSMTYHLPRIMHWVQNGSVAHYETGNARQLFYSPFGEYAILHALLMSGDRVGGHWANLPGFMGYVGCVWGMMLLMTLLGLGKRGVLITGIATASLPMGVMQGSGTQNDVIVGVMLVYTCLFGVMILKDYARNRRIDWMMLLGLGVSAGLAGLTKGTGLFYLLPILGVLVLTGMWVMKRDVLIVVACGSFVIVMLNGGQWVRNMQMYDGMFGPEWGRKSVVNQRIDGGVVMGNMVRNTTAHFQVKDENFNHGVERFTRDLLGILKVATDAKENTFTVYHLPEGRLDEDRVGNPAHMVLIGLGMMGCVAMGVRRRRGWERGILLAMIVGGMWVVFAVLVKWQLWGARLQLPIFVLGCGLIGYLFYDCRRGAKRLMMMAAVGLMFATGLYTGLMNVSRPMVRGEGNIFLTSDEEKYFTNGKGRYQGYKQATDIVRLCKVKTLLLMFGEDDWEYPVWMLLKDRVVEHEMRIEHMGMQDPVTGKMIMLKEKTSGDESLILSVNPKCGAWMEREGFAQLWKRGDVALWVNP